MSITYILFTGFSQEEQELIQSWSIEASKEDGEEVFSVKDSVQLGRLVEINKDYFDSEVDNIKLLIKNVRDFREVYNDYHSYLSEIRVFFNRTLKKIFTVKINDDNNLVVQITNLPFDKFFKMVDKGFLTAYLGMQKENFENIEDIEEVEKLKNKDNSKEMVETGFLSRYLACNYIDNTSAFLIESNNFIEFRKILQFILILGEIIGWSWKTNNKEGEQ